MAIKTRLNRLEAALALKRKASGRKTFDQAFEEFLALNRWLGQRGYADALTAVEAGETGSEGLSDLLREEAAYDHIRRAWKRIEKALDSNELPADADVRLLKVSPVET
jgi:hypothetical protein